jgi:Ca2+-binding RTX toxin-like protein
MPTSGNDTLAGTTGNDTIDALGGNDSVFGDAGNDILIGNTGDDTLNGGIGNDTLRGGIGNDSLVGGDGAADLAEYFDATGAVTIDFTAGSATGAAGTDVLSGLEWAWGGAFGDSIRGDSLSNYLAGRGGADTLRGEGGDDFLAPDLPDTVSLANDLIDGGPGFDRLELFNATAALSVDLVQNRLFGFGTDTLISVEGALGGSGDDTMIGDSIANYFWGRAGVDSLSGAAGADTLFGGLANDLLFGGTENDQLWGDDGNNIAGGGADSLDGGDGDDSLSGEQGNDTLNGGNGFDIAEFFGATAGVTVNLQTGGATGGAGVDSLIGIEAVYGSAFGDSLTAQAGAYTYLWGREGNDTLIGGGVGDDLWGGTGADQMFGGNGDDALGGEQGNDYLDGGPGNDILRYAVATTQGVLLNMTAGWASAGPGDFDVFVNMEGAELSAFNDTAYGAATAEYFNGNDGNDQIYAGDGVDTIAGGLGNDTLFGEGGNDLIFTGGGADYISGGAGIDTITMQNVTTQVVVSWSSLIMNTASGYAFVTDAEVLRTGSGNDIITTWNVATPEIRGGLGNDFMAGGLGIDTLVGGAGFDWMAGGRNLAGTASDGAQDRFRFLATTDSTGSQIDAINDFQVGEDKIDLSAIDANTLVAGVQTFTIGTMQAGVAGRLQVDVFGSYSLVRGDVNGDGLADISILVFGFSTGPALTAGDFILV